MSTLCSSPRALRVPAHAIGLHNKLFGRARRNAALGLVRHGERETATALPQLCPYRFEQIVGQDWYPQNRHGLVDEVEV
jgi:hypothetical protein